uniref:Triple gene block protein 2 n=1 Tax=Cassava virus X TaxID=1977392 RepID=A0A1W5VPJ7_9VIRU|nr:triple gene block protein 2 [Cassava virus X]
MPLQAPPDPNRTYQLIGVCAAIVCVCYFLSQDNRGFSGDRENSFPNGGRLSYCKTAVFHPPHRGNPQASAQIFFLVLALTALIIFLSKRTSHICPQCRG